MPCHPWLAAARERRPQAASSATTTPTANSSTVVSTPSRWAMVNDRYGEVKKKSNHKLADRAASAPANRRPVAATATTTTTSTSRHVGVLDVPTHRDERGGRRQRADDRRGDEDSVQVSSGNPNHAPAAGGPALRRPGRRPERGWDCPNSPGR